MAPLKTAMGIMAEPPLGSSNTVPKLYVPPYSVVPYRLPSGPTAVSLGCGPNPLTGVTVKLDTSVVKAVVDGL